jgi:hypothetical protein
LNYNDWAETLYSYFFHSSSANEHIFFSIDGALLVELSDFTDESDAKSSLGQAVSAAIDDATWNCKKVANRIDVWERKGSEGAHPALPFLALTVLAVAEMAKTGEAHSASNYYKPLRKLIDPNDKKAGSPGSKINGFSAHIENIWESVERWSKDKLRGETGILMSVAGNLRYVGLALQHNLVRTSDLRRLPQFFLHMGLAPDDKESVNSADLRRGLHAWSLARSEQWAARLAVMSEKKASAETELQEHCERILMQELSKWDGRLRDSAGRLAGHLRLGIDDLKRPKPSLFIEWREGLPDKDTLTLPNGEREEILKPKSINWYGDDPLPISRTSVEYGLKNGLELSGGSLKYIFEENDLYLLRFSDDLGKWASVSNFNYGQPHCFFTHRTHSAEISAFLQQHSSSDSNLSSKQVDADTFMDWFISSPFRLDALPSGDIPQPLKPYLRSGRSFRLRLLSGLKIGPTKGTYLKGGEPIIALSDLADSNTPLNIKNTQSGRIRTVATGAECSEIELWSEHLEAGPYEVTHGLSRVSFRIVEGIKSSVSGDAATEALESSIGVVTGTIAIPEAARTAGKSIAPYTVKFSPKESTFLGRSPIDFHQELVHPRWWEHKLGGLIWDSIDVWLSFEPVWHLTMTGQGEFSALLIGDPESANRPDLTCQNVEWSKVIQQSTLTEGADSQVIALWATYLEAAQS